MLRHPAVSGWQGRCYGRSDVPVDGQVLESACHDVLSSLYSSAIAPVVRGAATVKRAGKGRSADGPVEARFRIYTSPLGRCRSFAALLAEHDPRLFASPMVDERLLEIDFGAWEGIAWDDINRADIDAWAADPWHYRPGGGESAHAMLMRWRSFHAEVLGKRAVEDAAVPLLLTHAGIIRLALFDAGRLSESDMWLHAIAHAQLMWVAA